MGVRQVIRDNGYTKLLEAHNRVYTKVGFPEGGAVAPGNGEQSVSDISELVLIGAVHEFGAPSKNIPERSYMRSALDENIEQLKTFKYDQYKLFLQRKITLLVAIGRVGEWMKAKIQEKIRKGPFIELSEATIKRKGSTKPLIDTAQMLNSVQHIEVEKQITIMHVGGSL